MQLNKKLLHTLNIMSCLGLVACGSDDDNSTTNGGTGGVTASQFATSLNGVEIQLLEGLAKYCEVCPSLSECDTVEEITPPVTEDMAQCALDLLSPEDVDRVMVYHTCLEEAAREIIACNAELTMCDEEGVEACYDSFEAQSAMCSSEGLPPEPGICFSSDEA